MRSVPLARGLTPISAPAVLLANSLRRPSTIAWMLAGLASSKRRACVSPATPTASLAMPATPTTVSAAPLTASSLPPLKPAFRNAPLGRTGSRGFVCVWMLHPLACYDSCSTCDGPNINSCTSCPPHLFYNPSLNTCSDSCSSGFYAVDK